MPKIPDGAKVPTDHQTASVKPEKHHEGWELLRPPIDVEYWEYTDLIAAFSAVRQRGDSIALTTANIKAIGALSKLLQEELAVDSNAFKTWIKAMSLEHSAKAVVELAAEYAAALGEAPSSDN